MSPNGTVLIGGSLQSGADASPVNGIYDSSAATQGNAGIVWAGKAAFGSNASTISVLSQQRDAAPDTTSIGVGTTVFSLNPSSGAVNQIDNQGRTLAALSFRATSGAFGTYTAGDVRALTAFRQPADAYANSSALYYGGASSLQMVVRTGTTNDSAWNKRPDNSNIVNYSFLPLATNGVQAVISNLGPISNNGAGESAFTITLRKDGDGSRFNPFFLQGNGGQFFPGISTANDDYIMRRSSSGALSVVARESDAVAGLSSVSIAGFGFATYGARSLNNNGRLLFLAGLANAGSSTTITSGVNDLALFVHDPANGLKVFRQRGAAAPRDGGDPFDPVNIDSFGQPRINNNNQVLWTPGFVGSGVNTAAGAPDTSSGLTLTQLAADSSIMTEQLLARRGDALPGSSSLYFGDFFNTMLNNSGQVVFGTQPQSATGSTTGQVQQLWAWDPTDGFRLLLQAGDIIDGILVAGWNIDASGTSEGTSAAFNDNGYLAVSIYSARSGSPLTGESAVISLYIPAPGTAAVAGLAGLLAMRRRRR